MRPMNVMSEPVSMKRKSKTPICGACGPTAMPMMIRNGMLDRPSLWASATPNAIRASARPISKMMLSTGSPRPSFNQQALDGIDRAPVAREYERRAFVQDGVGFPVDALRLVCFEYRDDGCARACANLQIADSSADARRSRSEERRVGKECRSRW